MANSFVICVKFVAISWYLQALVAFKLYKSMARESEDDDMEADCANDLLAYARLSAPS